MYRNTLAVLAGHDGAVWPGPATRANRNIDFSKVEGKKPLTSATRPTCCKAAGGNVHRRDRHRQLHSGGRPVRSDARQAQGPPSKSSRPAAHQVPDQHPLSRANHTGGKRSLPQRTAQRSSLRTTSGSVLAAGTTNALTGKQGAAAAGGPRCRPTPTSAGPRPSKIRRAARRSVAHIYKCPTRTATATCFLSTTPNVARDRPTSSATPGRYNTIDFGNGGDIRGLIRAASMPTSRWSNDQTKVVPRPWRARHQGQSRCIPRHACNFRADRIQKAVSTRGKERTRRGRRQAVGGPRCQVGRKRAAGPRTGSAMVYNSFKRS